MTNLKVVESTLRTPLERLVEDYLAHVGARGLSRKTLSHYSLVLRTILLKFCAEREITEPAQLDQRVLDRLGAQLLDVGTSKGPLSRASVRSYLETINHFLAWAHKEKEVGEARTQLPRLERQVIVTLDRKEIQDLEDAAESERDKLIVRILADTGMRAGELAKLELGDLLEEGRDRYLRVRGKGRRQRKVPIAPALYQRLRRYRDKTRPQDADTERLFVSLRRRARSGAYEPLEVSGIGQLVRELGYKAGIEKRVHAHGLRHAFATWALRRNMNPITVAAIVGHSDLSMIQRVYSHLNQQDAAAAMMKLLRAEED